jgi:hypothetical protein
MGLADYMVGPAEPFTSGRNPDLGGLLILLHNGKPHKVIAPGERFIRLWNTPWTGNLQIMQVKTGDVVLLLTFTDIPTLKTDEKAPQAPHVKSVKIELAVKLNPDRQYRALKDYIASAGAEFADRLQIDLVRDLEGRLHAALASKSINDLRTANLTALMVEPALPFRLARGLLEVSTLHVSEPVWPDYTESIAGAYFDKELALVATQHKKEVDIARVIADGDIGLQQAEINAAIQKEVYEQNFALAKQLKIPIEYVMDPQWFTNRVEAARGFLQAIASSGNPRIWRDAAGPIASAVHAAGLTSELPKPSQLTDLSDEAIQVAMRTLPGRVDASANGAEAAEDLDFVEILTGVIDIDHHLNSDGKVARAWQSVFGRDPSQLRGSGLHVNGTTAYLIVVSRNASGIQSSERKKLLDVLRQLLLVSKVRFIALHPDGYKDLARQLMEKLLALEPNTLRIEAEILGEVPVQELHLSVDTNDGSPRDMVRAFMDEYRNEHHALEDLFPFTATQISPKRTRQGS